MGRGEHGALESRPVRSDWSTAEPGGRQAGKTKDRKVLRNELVGIINKDCENKRKLNVV